ncbi:hypothetical protein [Vibrio barjaei]|uniref:hypothetical protein n=1 Tax=Vibrio barjaei TaxID=1676683 RepID=UPI0022843990|nr:hypothetical protein [Vibrio barjaei]MCY9872971.1 hypothetical protein [Vibrio barjaei]
MNINKTGLRDCQLCEGEKAIGKYYVDRSESENYGWWRVCETCSDMVSRVGANVQFYRYTKQYKEQYEFVEHPLPEHVKTCDHTWDKWSNVNQFDKKRDGIFDWMQCSKCNVYGKQFIIGQPPIDLMMEIDLSCTC